MSYIYILLSLKDHRLYTGFSSDVERRLAQHKQGEVESTRHRRPLKLIHYECYLLEEDAKRREKYLKTSDGKRDIKRQLRVLFEKYQVGVDE